jgi:hypothetical protein
MKEYILEQIVDDWFVSQKGFFTKHNIKFRPSERDKQYDPKQDSVHSDIDTLAFNANAKAYERVCVVSCKSWQGGFDFRRWVQGLTKEPNEADKTKKKRQEWKYFRELVVPKWTKAFVDAVENETGTKQFTYYLVCTKTRGNKEDFENCSIFKERLKAQGADVKFKVMTFSHLFNEYFARFRNRKNTTLEATAVGRLLQLIKASNALEELNRTNHPTK